MTYSLHLISLGRSACWQCSVALVVVMSLATQTPADDSSLPSITPGTIVERSDESRWNRVVLTSQPRLTAGDIDAVPQSIRESAATLWLTIMSTVATKTDENGEKKYRLAEVGVGTSIEVDDRLRIVTSASAAELGVNLGLVKRQQLLENERQFAELRKVAQTTTLIMFDAPAIVYRQNKHVSRIMRHLVWVNPRTGVLASLVWFLEERDGSWRLVDEPARLLSAGFSEQRIVHVDGGEFNFLGIPSQRAFALADLPPGQVIDWSPETRTLASLPSYSMEQLRMLSRGLNAALETARGR